MKWFRCSSKKQTTSTYKTSKTLQQEKERKYCEVRILHKQNERAFILTQAQTLHFGFNITNINYWTLSLSLCVCSEEWRLFVCCFHTRRSQTLLSIVSHKFPNLFRFKPLQCLSHSPVFFFFLVFFLRIKPHWASLPLSCDFVKAIDFQLHPAPSLKPQKAYTVAVTQSSV